ncbi:MAG: hypothetical protein K6A38_06355 [Lachnospiraceae bacterium]|nr:hypothetical protein [Lachnospiraceae bacterium]
MKLLLFKRDGICYNLVNDFSDMLADELNKLGWETAFFDITPYGTGCPAPEVLNGIINRGFDAAFAINAVGQQDYSIDGLNIYEKMGIPFFHYIIDHPIEHQVSLRSELPNYYVLCIDPDHVEYVKKYFPNVKDAFFLPHGGFGSLDNFSEEEYMSREYDIMFSGSHYPLSNYENEIRQYPPAIQKLVITHIEYMTEHRDMKVEDGLKNVLSDMGITDLAPLDFRNYAIATAMTYKYMKSYFREEIIRYIMESDLPLHIFGSGWEELSGEGSGKTVLHQPVPFNRVNELFKKTRIALNVMPLFKSGSHERVPNAMLNGTAVLSDHSAYLDNELGDLIGFYDLKEPWNVANTAFELMSDWHRVYLMTEKAYSYAKENLTWKSRAKDIASYISESLKTAGA